MSSRICYYYGAPNKSHDKVPEECIKKYVTLHRKNDAIIPDILVYNQPGDHNAGGEGARFVESIYDIKTMRIDKAQSFYSETKKRNFRRAVDAKVIRVRKEYQTRSEKLDTKCGEGYTNHPFSEALEKKFNSGGVHPVVFCAFGEINVETEQLIKRCAKYAASKCENSHVTPLSNTLQKGTAYQVANVM